jgi:hypothetical protein
VSEVVGDEAHSVRDVKFFGRSSEPVKGNLKRDKFRERKLHLLLYRHTVNSVVISKHEATHEALKL